MSTTFEEFQNKPSSQKITLAILEASKRLIAFTLHSGSVYKLLNFDISVISSIQDSGANLIEVFSLSDVIAGTFYNDRENKTLYLRTSDSTDPNSKFLHITFKLFFSDLPVNLPYDLASGFDVHFEPMLKSTSAFGVEIDTINQTSEAIEGSGTLTLYNDQEFWPANFDKLAFENKSCFIYSYSKELEASQAKLLFRGLVEKKSYSSKQIQFSLRDQLSELRAPVALANLEDLGERTNETLAKAKQRMVLGRVYGHRLTNLDEVLDGYPITGTISINLSTNTVTGSSTQFLGELSPGDELLLEDTYYSIATIPSNTSLTLTENFSGTSNLSSVAGLVKPDQPKRYMNRRWLVAGHALRQPTTTIQAGSSISRITVGSTQDMIDGDWIWVGNYPSGELVQINQVLGSGTISLRTSLNTNPTLGMTVFRPAVQNVRIDDVPLVYDQHFTFDANTGILVLKDTAETAAPAKQMANNLVFNSTTTVTGVGLSSLLKPGSLISCVGQADYFEVLEVVSDTQVTLRTAATFTDTDKGLYKAFILDPENSAVTCDVLGRTVDNTSTGALLATAPSIIKALLTDLGFQNSIDDTSFDDSEELAYEPIGLVVPVRYDETSSQTYRDVFNKINQSVFGSLIQTNDFKFGYIVLQPFKSSIALKIEESDILKFTIESAADKIVKTAIVNYRPLEYNYLSSSESKSSAQKTSDIANFMLRTNRERTFESVLVDQADAQRYANRWSFILENASTSIKVETKLQAISLQIGDIVEISHRKIYQRYGSLSTRKLGLVESVKKSGSGVTVTIVDLSNAFNRVAAINNLPTIWSETNEDGRLYGGFYTDTNGLIDNSEFSFGTNLIW